MTSKVYLTIVAMMFLSSSCLKRSIADAMLGKSGKETSMLAKLSYEINGELKTLSVNDADQLFPPYKLACEKTSGGYVLGAIVGEMDFIFTFYTDSLTVGNYKYTSNYGPEYVTTFGGYPSYVYGPTDHMNFNVTSYNNGRISGNFSGQITPAIRQGYPDNVYGSFGSVLIKNGSFSNVPIIY